MDENMKYLYMEDEETESTEKMFSSNEEGKFEIVLDVVKVNTTESIGEVR